MTYTFDSQLSPSPSDVHIHSIWLLDYNDWGKTCIATSAPYWRSRKSQCCLIPWSPSSTQHWMHWTIVSGRDRSGRLVFVGDVWFSESVEECSGFRNVSPFLQECQRHWSQYSYRPLQCQTCPLYHDVRDDGFLALCAVPLLFQVSLSCRDFGHAVLPLTQVSLVCRKNLVLLATHQQQSLELRVSPNSLDWFWGIGLAWKNRDELFLQVTVERVSQLVDVQL